MNRKELSIKWVVRECEADTLAYNSILRGPEDALTYFHPWAGEAQEVLVALFLDLKLRVIGHKEIGRGFTTVCPMDPQSIFRAALLAGAGYIILAHNHPAGDPTPSPQDIEATTNIMLIGEVLDLPILEHFIVSIDQDGNLVSSSIKSLCCRKTGPFKVVSVKEL